ncbi:MAG TPA: NAD(P)/FAD-dependent oxidoreductase [Gemmatimonas sp.]|uniref:NAD(P)/FAD-dependent oxidoreductase n=1 Tax=Gemmatimonas sp. TaxID=1962908 RepID=UPI002ED93A48
MSDGGRWQVIVVGGGPAGTSAAWHCAQAGLAVCLVDRARFPRNKPCAEYVSPEGSRILDRMGALSVLERGAATYLTGMVVHAPSGGRIHGEFVAQHGYRAFRDRGLGIRREYLDALLLSRAREAGVTVLEDTRVTQLLHDAHGAVNGVETLSPHGTQSLHAPLVIGADGLNSVVANRAGLAHRSRYPRRVAYVAHYRDVARMGTLGEMHVTTDGYVGLAQVGDGAGASLTNVALVIPTSSARTTRRSPEDTLTTWLSAHPQLAERFASAERVTPVRAVGPFASRARRAWAPGVMLTGDAADFLDPFTGEGIYAALAGGELLAPLAHAVVHATSADARQQTLASYERARQKTFGGKWRLERLIALAVAWPPLLNHAARVLSRDRDLADLLIGATGDFVPPSAVLTPRTLLRFLS